MNSSENGVFCARGVNGMHAMGLPLHFCSSTTNAMPFSATLPCSAGVQVITWVGGSSKLPRPVESKLFSTVFKNLQLPQASSIHHHRIALNHHLPDFSPLRGEKFKCYHWRQVTQSRSGEGGGGGGGLPNFLSPILFSRVCFQSFHSPPAVGVGSKICIIRVLAPDQIRNIQGQCQPAGTASR